MINEPAWSISRKERKNMIAEGMEALREIEEKKEAHESKVHAMLVKDSAPDLICDMKVSGAGHLDIRNRGIYLDKSTKGRKTSKRHKIHRADITINGRRFKKRGRNKLHLGRWLSYAEHFGRILGEDEFKEEDTEANKKIQKEINKASARKAFFKWQKSPQGKEYLRKYRQTEAWKAIVKRHEQKESRKISKQKARIKYRLSEKGKARKNQYAKEQRMAQRIEIEKLRAEVAALRAENKEILLSLEEALKEAREAREIARWGTVARTV